MALLNLQDKSTEAIDNNGYLLVICIDLAKAFGTVDHKILVGKLSNYGMRGLQLEWFKNYLDQRLQCFSSNWIRSNLRVIKHVEKKLPKT